MMALPRPHLPSSPTGPQNRPTQGIPFTQLAIDLFFTTGIPTGSIVFLLTNEYNIPTLSKELEKLAIDVRDEVCMLDIPILYSRDRGQSRRTQRHQEILVVDHYSSQRNEVVFVNSVERHIVARIAGGSSKIERKVLELQVAIDPPWSYIIDDDKKQDAPIVISDDEDDDVVIISETHTRKSRRHVSVSDDQLIQARTEETLLTRSVSKGYNPFETWQRDHYIQLPEDLSGKMSARADPWTRISCFKSRSD
ncbi:unnamed protein product [Aureobasidium pullulans]|nr:unnamed protein product [Aureobasidium pullulans]